MHFKLTMKVSEHLHIQMYLRAAGFISFRSVGFKLRFETKFKLWKLWKSRNFSPTSSTMSDRKPPAMILSDNSLTQKFNRHMKNGYPHQTRLHKAIEALIFINSIEIFRTFSGLDDGNNNEYNLVKIEARARKQRTVKTMIFLIGTEMSPWQWKCNGN